jgi:hypothetical protein
MIHRAMEKLKAALPASIAKEMAPMVQEVFHEHKLPHGFAEEILKRVDHWERFFAGADERVKMVMDDPEWLRLVEREIELEPLTRECRAIREQIAHLEACHEHYTENVEDLLRMIGDMKPGQILDCGRACDAREQEAAAYAQALEAWQGADHPTDEADACQLEVVDLLGQRTEEKARLVDHLIGKLRNDAYRVYAQDEEDFDRVESRIQHLEICNYNWPENLRIVLKEIAAGRRLFEWHIPDGYNAHGDCPDRIAELQDAMRSATAWAEGNTVEAGQWAEVLGPPTPEKRWLVASLCKNVAAQHATHEGEARLPKPAVR